MRLEQPMRISIHTVETSLLYSYNLDGKMTVVHIHEHVHPSFQVDESGVEILSMTPTLEATAPSTCESYRYPRAGEYNLTLTVYIQP